MARKLQEEYSVTFDRTATNNREIQARTTQARRIIGCINEILWSSEISKQRKYNVYNTSVKSSLLYGAETWRITEQNKRKLEAVEMDAIKRSLRISRKDRIQNEEVRRRMGIDGTLYDDIERMQLIWYGHVQRMGEERLPKKIMKWVPQQRCKRGRPKKTWKEGVVRAMSTRDLRDGQWDNRRE
ncbi:uncharacterized protein [Linepithema humile]|uniref:uncharacterized protein n=1 Tax=Linepithema humile TaxID=83485 RepID=UPI00351DE9C4